MWGTLMVHDIDLALQWFIPTHVGNSSGWHSTIVSLTVHPHACGELDSPNGEETEEIGSSPRMWGTLGI